MLSIRLLRVGCSGWVVRSWCGGRECPGVGFPDRVGPADAGIWTVGTAMGLINDIPTVGELVSRIVSEAEELITGRLAGIVAESEEEKVPA